MSKHHSDRRQYHWQTLGLHFWLAFSIGCAGPSIQTRVDVVRADIERARAKGAYDCAPNELARSESHAEFSETELRHGNAVRAQQHLDIAKENVTAALKKSQGCGSKTVSVSQVADADGDGIADGKDECPNRAEDFDRFQDADGCPDTDNDGDGVLDSVDRCPLEPEDRDDFLDNDGCPDADNDEDGLADEDDKCPNSAGKKANQGCPLDDVDKDGVIDSVDKCPNRPEDFDGDRDEDGCPDLDTDADGLADEDDKCPEEPEDVDGFEDEDGCPEKDNDSDGTLDSADKCPNVAGPPAHNGCPDADGDGVYDGDDECISIKGIPQPENPNRNGCPNSDKDADGIYDDLDACPARAGTANPDDAKANGCPHEYNLIVIHGDHIEIKQQVKFATAKATIQAESFPLLAEVADAIRSSNIRKVHIEGHTDNRGGESTNLELSQKRADAVRTHLIESEDIDDEILDAVGFGEAKPLESNATERGRAHNRRVEFKVERASP